MCYWKLLCLTNEYGCKLLINRYLILAIYFYFGKWSFSNLKPSRLQFLCSMPFLTMVELFTKRQWNLLQFNKHKRHVLKRNNKWSWNVLLQSLLSPPVLIKCCYFDKRFCSSYRYVFCALTFIMSLQKSKLF